MPLLTNITTQDKDGFSYAIGIEYTTPHDTSLVLNLTIRDTDPTPLAFTLSFDPSNGTLTLNGFTANLSVKAACIAACVLTKLAKHVLDCWNSGMKTPGDILNCLKKKGVTITLDVAECLSGCLL